MKFYMIDEDQFAKLERMHIQLHGGTDRERDYGHRLWLLCNQIRDTESEYGESDEEGESK